VSDSGLGSGVKLFQINILDIGSHIGKAPRDVIVVSDYYAGQSGSGDAGDTHARRAQVDHIPDWRRGRRQMRIVCQHGLPDAVCLPLTTQLLLAARLSE